MKRSFSFADLRPLLVVAVGTSFIASTYGLVRLAYGLFLPDVQRQLGLGAAAAGYISSGASLAYCGAAAAGFVLGQRLPRVLVLAATAAACGGVWAMAAADSVVVFGTAAVISSAAAGFASPALVAIVGRNVDAQGGNRAQQIVNAGTGPGLVVAGFLALVLLPDWRTPWVLVGVVTAALGVAV